MPYMTNCIRSRRDKTTNKMISTAICVILIGFSPTNAKRLDKTPQRNEAVTLVPLHSLTPLMCEVIFNQDSDIGAIWYRNGKEIGRVTSQSNYVYEQRLIDLKEIPEVGFLIISHIEIADEGDYWCELENKKQQKEQPNVYRLRAAFIESFNDDQLPIAYPAIPELGKTLTIECPTIKSYPKAVVSWRINDETIDFSSGRIEVTQNGSLLIRRYQSSDNGFYSCSWSNFAGHTSTQLQLFPPLLYSSQNDVFDYGHTQCSSYFRNGLLWFLVGCLSTSLVVLIYLMAGLFCHKYSRHSTHFSPLHSLFNADPSLAPGFRKVVAPVHDYIRNPNASTNAQDV